jgi:hypothetical protein
LEQRGIDTREFELRRENVLRERTFVAFLAGDPAAFAQPGPPVGRSPYEEEPGLA